MKVSACMLSFEEPKIFNLPNFPTPTPLGSSRYVCIFIKLRLCSLWRRTHQVTLSFSNEGWERQRELSDVAPHGIFDNVLKHFGFHNWGVVVVLLVCKGYSPGMLLNILRYTGQSPTTKNYPFKNVTSAGGSWATLSWFICQDSFISPLTTHTHCRN